MVRDLVENAIQIVKKNNIKRAHPSGEKANRRLVKVLVPGIKKEQKKNTNPYEQMMNMFNAAQQPEEPKKN